MLNPCMWATMFGSDEHAQQNSKKQLMKLEQLVRLTSALQNVYSIGMRSEWLHARSVHLQLMMTMTWMMEVDIEENAQTRHSI